MRQQQPNQTKEVPSHLVATWEVIQALVSECQIRINKIYSFIFPEDKNPDVVPQENSDDEYTSEEKAFDRLTVDSHRIIYTPHLNTSPPSLSPISFTSKPYGELSLTTNPAFALYNSPQRRPPQYTAPPLLSNSNIYSRIPSRAFTPYDTRTSPVSSNYGLTMPLLMQNNGITLSNVDEKSWELPKTSKIDCVTANADRTTVVWMLTVVRMYKINTWLESYHLNVISNLYDNNIDVSKCNFVRAEGNEKRI